ncbi:MAG: thiamine phosphate synthase, partial [Synergistaceae bacterium]|nr:thiamine phosphate synthase [Synergistaceae bacterium]
MKADKNTLKLYAVTDRKWLNGGSLAEQVEKAARAGVTMVQLREK